MVGDTLLSAEALYNAPGDSSSAMEDIDGNRPPSPREGALVSFFEHDNYVLSLSRELC